MPGMLHWRKGRVCPDGIGPRHVKGLGKALFNAIMSQTWSTVSGEVARGDCTSGQQRIGFGAAGEGAFARVECLMVLEEGKIGSRTCLLIWEWLKLPTLTSSLLSVVLERLEVNGS